MTLSEVAAQCELSVPTVMAAHLAYASGGMPAVVVTPRDHKPGDGRFKRLVTNADGKTFLVLAHLRVHHARRVKAWPADQEAEIAVFCLSSYNPAPNPDECLNADVKHAVTRRMPARSKGQLGGAAIGHPSKLRKSPARVRKYFQHKPVRHAA